MRLLTRLPLPRDGSSSPGPLGPRRRGASHCPGSAGQTPRPRGPELAAEPHPWDTAPGAQSKQGTLTTVHRGHQACVLVCLSLCFSLTLCSLSSLLLSAPILSVLKKTPKSCFGPVFLLHSQQHLPDRLSRTFRASAELDLWYWVPACLCLVDARHEPCVGVVKGWSHVPAMCSLSPLSRPPTCSGLSWTPHTGHTHTGSRI